MKPLSFATAALTAALLASPAWTQTETAASFTSENAILDTGIAFAIGAREAQQNLRGSFGWSTFQEGLVEGVYFRFDPDGYARFSPSPRLDTDVFEVICRPRTYTCMARKDALSIIPLPNGKVQLKLEDVRPGDGLYLSDSKSELQLPDRILQPLELQFETLLSAGGELIVRRGEKEILKTSLSGFGAVVPYLRWISARQDYTVLPRTWPVPNAQGSADGSITNAVGWASPMPQPQAIQQVGPGAQYVNSVQADPGEQVTVDLQELRTLLAERSNAGEPSNPPAAAPVAEDRTAKLERTVAELMAEIRLLRTAGRADDVPAPQSAAAPSPLWTDPVAQVAPMQPQAVADPAPDLTARPMAAQALPTEVDHLDYLVNKMGLAPKTAMILLQIVGTGTEQGPQSDAMERSYHDSLAVTILNELERDLARADASDLATASGDLTDTKKQMDPGQLDPLQSSATVESDGPLLADLVDVDSAVDGVSTDTGVTNENPMSKPARLDLSQSEYQPLTAYFKSVIQADP